jgi:hypothetical protein
LPDGGVKMPNIEHAKKPEDVERIMRGMRKYVEDTGYPIQIIWGDEDIMTRVFR